MVDGGMVGKGTLSTLCIVVAIASAWARPSFAVAGISAALFGAASIFMTFEGFQLLTHDYNAIETPKKILTRVELSAIVIVTATCVVVTLGTVILIGTDQVVQYETIALVIAGRQASGLLQGLVFWPEPLLHLLLLAS